MAVKIKSSVKTKSSAGTNGKKVSKKAKNGEVTVGPFVIGESEYRGYSTVVITRNDEDPDKKFKFEWKMGIKKGLTLKNKDLVAAIIAKAEQMQAEGKK